MSEEEKKTPSFIVNFKLVSLQPDRRAYKPSNPLLEPIELVKIAVSVPIDGEHVHNAAKILQEQLTSGNPKISDPVLTPQGLKFIVDQFEAAMSEPEEVLSESELDETEWDDSETTWDDDVEGTDEWTDETPEEDLTWEEEEDEEAEDESFDDTWDDIAEETSEETEDEEDVEWDEEDL